MSEDTPNGPPASTYEQFCFILSADTLHDGAQLSLEAIKQERKDIRKMVKRLIGHMSVRSPQDQEWQQASTHLEWLARRLSQLGKDEAQAILGYARLGRH